MAINIGMEKGNGCAGTFPGDLMEISAFFRYFADECIKHFCYG